MEFDMACDGCGCRVLRVVQYNNPTEVETVNASFEEPLITSPNNFEYIPEADIPGWETDDPIGQIEVWRNPGAPGSNQGTGLDGEQYAEINAFVNTRLFQTLTVPAAAGPIQWEWGHSARLGTGVNVARFLLGDANLPNYQDHDAVSVSTKQPNDNTWTFYSGEWQKPAGVTEIVVSLEALTPTSSAGNLVDAVRLLIAIFETARVEQCRGEDPEFRFFDTTTDEELTATQVATIRPFELAGLGIPGFD